MSIKNPLLERYSSQKKCQLLSTSTKLVTNQKQGQLLSASTKHLTSSVLKRSFSGDGPAVQSTKALKPRVLSSSPSLLKPKPLTSGGLTSISSSKLPCSFLSKSLSLSSPLSSELKSPTSSNKAGVIKARLSAEDTTDSKTGEQTDASEISPFLDGEDFIPVTVKTNVINNYFDTMSKATVKLTKEEVLKQDFINLAACSLIHVPKLDNKNDSVRIELINLADKMIEFDPEFILKMALFTRRVLNIRVTANFLVALAAFKKECRRYIKKYYKETVLLPSDWIDVAELYTSLGDKHIGFSALPVCLRKAMTKKFPTFDVYQIGKYNKKPKKKAGKGTTEESENEDDETKLYERHHFTLKQLIRKIHLCDPPDIVMPILGKKYPETQEEFYRSRLSGLWDENQAGKRMKVPTPYTWETQLAAKGNNSSTWKDLILSRKLPYMAMLRNLRNIINSGVKDNIHKIVQKKLCSPLDVKRSKQFPFRFLSAYAVLDSLKEAKAGQSISWSTTPEFEQDTLLDEYKVCLDKAVQLAAINNVKPIKGSLLLLFNCGDCMDEDCSTKGFGLTRTIREVAGLLTLMCMFSSEHCDVVYYNNEGTAMGRKIDTGGEILKFLSSFVSESKSMNQKISSSPNDYLSDHDCWTNIINKECHYDTIIQISTICYDWNVFKNIYRERVNNEVLTVQINLKSTTSKLQPSTDAHRNDVTLYGFSDQMLQYISERGSGDLLSNVESIDKKFNLLPLPKPMAQGYVTPLAKQVKSKVIRIFVSSTFLDLEKERRKLMNVLIPEINELVMEKNFTIQEVDLRWGVTKEEAASNKVILRCLEEVSRCHYFMCILGQRYGTTFSSYPKSPNPEYSWLETEESHMSMTEIEVRHALYHSDRNKLPAENMMFLIKEDASNVNANIGRVIQLVENYSFMEKELYIKKYKESSDDFEDIAKMALHDVVVKSTLEDVGDNLSDEDMHNSFLQQQAMLFVGRQNLVASLVSTMKKGQIIMIAGPGGTGKSALTAKALTMFPDDSKVNDFHHVVKLNSGSKDLNVLLTRICFHLSKILNEELEEHFEPISTLWGQMARCDTPFKILIDGCDELIHNSHELFSWLPDRVPSNITLIFTVSSPGQWSTYLNKKYSSITTFTVPKLSATEKVQVTKELLAAYGKKLEEKGFNSQLSLLLSKREANNPLYIDLCINQLRLNAVFENLTQCIEELPQTTEELYVKILKFTVHEVRISEKLLAYLYCSKNGVSEYDMLLFLQLKPLALANLLYYLKLFIHVDQTTGVMTLANQFARKVVQKHCFTEEKLADVHKDLALEYSVLLTHNSCHYISGRKDAYQSLLFHYAAAGDWNTVSSYLYDLNFVRQMVYLGLLPDLISVFNVDVTQLKGMDKVSYKNAMNKDSLKYLQQFLINNKTILSQEPFLLQQRLLLSSQHFADRVEHDDDLQFNDFVGSFKSLQESPQANKCTMNEHFNSVVTCLAASDVTNLVLVGFYDSKFQAINSTDSKTLQTYRGHTGPVTCCGFLTSSRFISAGTDGSLRLWGLIDSVCLATITPHIFQVQDIDVNDITKCVISAGIDRRVTVWHNDVIFDTIEFDNPMNCISFIENGKKFVAGSWTGEVYAYDLVSKVKITVKKSGKVHKTSIRALSAGKKQFATLDVTGIISVWDQMTLDVLQSIRLDNVTTLSYDFDDHLMYGLKNGIINITAGFGQMSTVPVSESGSVTALYHHTSALFVGYYSGAVYTVTPGITKKLTQHKGKVNSVTSISVSGFGGSSDKSKVFLASCADDGSLHLTSLHDGSACKEMAPHIGKILAVCSGPKNVIFTGGYDCAITAIQLEANDELTSQEVKLYGHQAPVSTLLLLGKGGRLISGSHDGSVKVWNCDSGKCIYTSSNAHTDWVTCSATTANDVDYFVTGSNDNLVILWKCEWDYGSSKIFPAKKLLGHRSPVNCVSVLGYKKKGDSNKIIIGGAQDGSLIMWNKDGKFISSTKPGTHGVNACTFHSDCVSSTNATAYIGTVDGDVKCMKTSKLDVVASFTHHTDTVKYIRGMNGNNIASISADNTLQCWSWSTTSATSTKLQSIADIRYVCCTDTSLSTAIAAVDKTGTVAQWSLDKSELTFISETEATDKVKSFALLFPSITDSARLYVPKDNESIDRTSKYLASQHFIIEIGYERTSLTNSNSLLLKVYSVKTPDELYMQETICLGNILTYADVTEEDILIVGTSSHHMHAWNLKTKRRMPSSSVLSTSVYAELSMSYQYLTAGTFYDGKNIMGMVTGYIKIPAKSKKNEYIVRVFNSAVTALECITGKDGEMVLFAGSKDGVIKVLTSDLKVMGMYHTNGPVTVLRVIRHPSRRLYDEVVVVAGDKCGCVHFLKWYPPRGRQVWVCPLLEVVPT